MGSEAAYWMIIIGIFILLLQSGLVDLTIFLQPTMLPLSLIIIGLVQLFLHYADFGSFGRVLKTILSLLLLLIILVNIGAFFSKLFTPSLFMNNFNDAEPLLSIEGNNFVSNFNDLTVTAGSNYFFFNYTDGENSTNFINGDDYSLNNNFWDAYINFMYLDGTNSSMSLNNNFANMRLYNSGSFENLYVVSNFANTIIHTGALTGESLLDIDSSFSNVEIYVDEDASYFIETTNSLGSIENNIGLKSSDYDNAVNRIHIIVSNKLGSVELHAE